MLTNIQVLRAVAALLVVHAHAAGLTGLKLRWDGGATGVDLFFVISGFIIAHVASQDSDRFLLRRLIRIVPIYWVSTIVLFLLVVVAPQFFRSTSADPLLLALSLIFIPAPWAVHTSDGLAHPTLAGGWTLEYEIYFYLVFAAALAVTKRRPTLLAGGFILVVVAVVQTTALDSRPVAHFYGYPIVVEFVLGMLAFHVVGWAAERARANPPGALSRALALLGVLGGLVCIAFTAEIFGSIPRWYSSGIPAFVVVTCAVLLERVHGVRITNRWALLVGDASYVLYLIHAYIVFGTIRLVLRGVHFSEAAGQLVALGITLLCTVVAIALYRLFEQPMLRALKRWLLPRGQARPASPPSRA